MILLIIIMIMIMIGFIWLIGHLFPNAPIPYYHQLIRMETESNLNILQLYPTNPIR
jgi:hypothetical protein